MKDEKELQRIPVTIYKCGRCGWVKKLQTWLVPRELLCTTCGGPCMPRIKEIR